MCRKENLNEGTRTIEELRTHAGETEKNSVSS